MRKGALLHDVQEDFNRIFPYLKIEFFRRSHITKALSPKDEKINPFTSLENVIKWDGDKRITFDEKMTTHAFESMMREDYGLFVQVFRKSGRVWIETSRTDDWTLERQNEEGEMVSSIHRPTSPEETTWDE